MAINRHINTHFNYYIYCLPGYTDLYACEELLRMERAADWRGAAPKTSASRSFLLYC